MYTTQINGTLFTPENPSIARQIPSPELDALWLDMEILDTHVITKEDVIKLGKDPSTVARFDNDYWGFGDDAYMARMDVFHQIHCLNMLRKKAFSDFPGYELPPPKNFKLHWLHLGHCTDILLQNIMCNANTELLTMSWMEDQLYPYPDMSINRQCKDMNTLLKWRDEHAVDAKKYRAMRKPAGVHEIPLPDGYFEVYGVQRDQKGPLGHSH